MQAADDAWDPNYNPAPVVPVGGEKGGEDLPDGGDGSLPRITDKDAAGLGSFQDEEEGSTEENKNSTRNGGSNVSPGGEGEEEGI